MHASWWQWVGGRESGEKRVGERRKKGGGDEVVATALSSIGVVGSEVTRSRVARQTEEVGRGKRRNRVGVEKKKRKG